MLQGGTPRRWEPWGAALEMSEGVRGSGWVRHFLLCDWGNRVSVLPAPDTHQALSSYGATGGGVSSITDAWRDWTHSREAWDTRSCAVGPTCAARTRSSGEGESVAPAR